MFIQLKYACGKARNDRCKHDSICKCRLQQRQQKRQQQVAGWGLPRQRIKPHVNVANEWATEINLNGIIQRLRPHTATHPHTHKHTQTCTHTLTWTQIDSLLTNRPSTKYAWQPPPPPPPRSSPRPASSDASIVHYIATLISWHWAAVVAGALTTATSGAGGGEGAGGETSSVAFPYSQWVSGDDNCQEKDHTHHTVPRSSKSGVSWRRWKPHRQPHLHSILA